MRVYTYVIATDRGSAPNYDPPSLTLAVCKPRIRRGASVGDVVLAFTGARLSPERHAVRWAGVVSEKLTFRQYWRDKRFASKKPGVSETPDNIYQFAAGELVQVSNTTHAAHDVARDLSGQDVLVFKRAWYFGEALAILPEKFKLRMTARRGHRVMDLADVEARRLFAWLDREAPSWKPRRSGGPSCGAPSPRPRSKSTC